MQCDIVLLYLNFVPVESKVKINRAFARSVSIACISLFVALLAACAPCQYRGGVAGGAMGGIAGAILDRGNPWRGGVVGATLGAIAGATIADISAQGAREAVYVGRPVEYRTDDGRGYYYAEPIAAEPRTGCRRVRERIYEDGRLVRERIKIVSVEPAYAARQHGDDDDD